MQRKSNDCHEGIAKGSRANAQILLDLFHSKREEPRQDLWNEIHYEDAIQVGIKLPTGPGFRTFFPAAFRCKNHFPTVGIRFG
jgi:hypothetical protein